MDGIGALCKRFGDFPVVQWLGQCTSMATGLDSIPILFRELKSHKPHGTAKYTKK